MYDQKKENKVLTLKLGRRTEGKKNINFITKEGFSAAFSFYLSSIKRVRESFLCGFPNNLYQVTSKLSFYFRKIGYNLQHLQLSNNFIKRTDMSLSINVFLTLNFAVG